MIYNTDCCYPEKLPQVCLRELFLCVKELGGEGGFEESGE